MIGITLIDKMGDDLTVVDAARVSFNKRSAYELSNISLNVEACQDAMLADRQARSGDGIIKQADDAFVYERVSDADAKLISYLAKHDHWSPFSHVMVQFRVEAPMFVARQWYNHRICLEKDCGWNEFSRRYVSDEPEFFFPERWHKAAANVKQGAAETEEVTEAFGGKSIKNLYAAHMQSCSRMYMGLLAAGVAPEDARMVLPMSLITAWIETGSLYAYARLCKLRTDEHAQSYTRLYARAVADQLRQQFPLSWEALINA